MKNYIFLLLFFVFSAFANDVVIKKINFIGNDAFFATALKEAIGVEEERFYKFWKKSPEYTIDDIEAMRGDVVEFYRSKGFFNVKVTIEQSNESITFRISEYDRMKVASVNMESPFYIKSLIALRQGDFFDADLFVKSKENILKYLGENGMPRAKLSAKAYIDIEKYEARLEFNISQTQKLKFGSISTNKLETIEDEYIKDKLRLQEGEPYDSKKIDESYKNLYATGAFESVNIKPILDGDGDSVPMDINVSLGKQRSFKAGVGYDTDEGPRLKAGWLHRNFYGNLKRFEAIAEVSGIRQNVGAKINIPKVLGFEFEDMAKYEKVKYQGYEEKIASNAFKFKIPYKTTTHYLGFLTESGRVTAEDESEDIKSSDFFINALTYEYTIDRRDSIIDAKKGFYTAWNIEFADNFVGSTINYLKSNIEARKIFGFDDGSYFRDFLFAARGNIGTINDFRKNDIPVFKRYFAGGSFSNRGYGYRKLGKKDNYGNNIGGNSIIDYSIEARYKTTKSLWGVVFFDSTLLNKNSLAFNGEYKPSVGMGFRYDTIIGPVRFDIGVPLREDKRSPVFHVSFGQAF
ncbi:MAG: autotransporter assembly complex family protein [Campylobacterales bacterium]